jgi:arylsulfatase A-like enzyme
VAEPSAERPNIVLILIDDMGWRDLSCYGSTFYRTPNIDALAASGTRFTAAYAAAPVCSPTRASLLTGRYPARVGITQFIGGHTVGRLCDVPYFHGLPLSEHSLARALRDGGYATWHVGKWHLGGARTSPAVHGFDVMIGGGPEGHPPTYFSPYGVVNLADGPDGEYLTDRITDEAIGLIDSHHGDRPFLLNLWHYAVHIPIQAPPELTEAYRAEAERQGLDTNAVVPGEPMPTWHQARQRVMRRTQQSDPGYAAMIENLDASVGRLVDALRETGQLEHTMIIFSSDNGGLSTAEGSPTCNLPLAEGKGWMADGGIRVPMIVSQPGVVPAGRTCDIPFTSPDLYPTLLSAAGLAPIPEQHCDGVDQHQVWRGGSAERGPIFWHYPHYSNQGSGPGAAVRDGRFKLVRMFETGQRRLFDLVADQGEERDLLDAEPAIADRLTRLLDDWAASIGVLVPQPNLRERPADLDQLLS